MKRIIFIISILSSIFCLANAFSIEDEFFYVHHKDGSYDRFLRCGIDSIVLSHYDLDSIYHEKLQTQVFYTNDRVCRIPLNEIADVSFVTRDESKEDLTESEIEAICKKTWNIVSDIISDNYLNVQNPSDLEFLFDDIRKLEYVEDVGHNDQDMFVILKNGSVWAWLFNNLKEASHDEYIEETYENTDKLFMNEDNLYLADTGSTPHIIKKNEDEKVKILIFNQTSRNEAFKYTKSVWDNLNKELESNGFDVTIKEENYGINDLHNYDLAVIHTHGFYKPETIGKGRHFLLTSYQVSSNYSGSFGTVTETRNGKKCDISYRALEEKDFKSLYSGNKFKERETFIFCSACMSLMENSDLADTFNRLGASGFMGYTDSSSVGIDAADSFFRSIIMDCTIQDAIDRIPDRYKHQTIYKDEETGEITELNAWLRVKYKSSINKNFCYAHLCPDDIHPHLIDMGNGVKWSCCNIGASSPYSTGDYYSWGETSTKHDYSYNDNYEMQHGVRFPSNIAATDHDAAWVHSSHTLRMPLVSEFQMLLNNSDIKWKFQDSQGGGLIISKINGNRLFIPAGGWIFKGEHMGINETGILWSAERNPSSPFSWFMQVIKGDNETGAEIAASRYSGHNVRGVAP